MAAVANSFEGGSNGTAVTVANSGGGSGDAFDAVSAVTGQTLNYDNTHNRGTLALKAATGSTSGRSVVAWTTSIGTQTLVYLRLYVYPTGNQSVAPYLCRVLSGGAVTSSTSRCALEFSASGQLILLNSSATAIAGMTSALAIPNSAWTRVELKLTLSSTAAVGSCEMRIYRTNPDGTSPDETLTNSGTANLGGSGDTYCFGICDTDANVGAIWFDDVAASTVDWIGPVGAGIATANVSEPVAVSTSSTVTRDVLYLSPSESVGVADSATAIRSVLYLSVSESVTVTDSARASPGVSSTESVTVADTVAILLSRLLVAGGETVTATDVATIGKTGTRLLGSPTITVTQISRPAALSRTRVLGDATAAQRVTQALVHDRGQGIPTLSGRASPPALDHTRALPGPSVNAKTLSLLALDRA